MLRLVTLSSLFLFAVSLRAEHGALNHLNIIRAMPPALVGAVPKDTAAGASKKAYAEAEKKFNFAYESPSSEKVKYRDELKSRDEVELDFKCFSPTNETKRTVTFKNGQPNLTVFVSNYKKLSGQDEGSEVPLAFCPLTKDDADINFDAFPNAVNFRSYDVSEFQHPHGKTRYVIRLVKDPSSGQEYLRLEKQFKSNEAEKFVTHETEYCI